MTSTHTNEEFSKLLATLFEERSKIQELELKLTAYEEKANSDDGNEKLKSMFLTLKKKYAQALHALNDKEKKCHEYEKLVAQLEPIRASYGEYQKKAEMAEEECLLLRNQQITLKSLLNEAQDTASRIQEELNQANDKLQASDHLREALEKENQELKNLREEYEFIKVQAQASQLKADELAEKLNGNQEQNLQHQQSAEKLHEENLKLQKMHEESVRRADQLERVIAFLRERSQEAHLDASNIKKEFQNAQQTIDSLKTELKGVKERLQEIEQLYEKEKREKSDAVRKFEEYQAINESLKTRLAALERQVDAASHLEQEVNNWKHKFDALAQEKSSVEKDLINARRDKEDIESQIKVAHQHLAKKVKEAAYLSEKIEEQKLQIHGLQNALETSKNKNSELQHTLDTQLQQEKRIEENLLDSLKTAEIHARKWEEKYFQMCDKWQEAEAHNKELKTLEEKFHQMQNLLGSFQNILSQSPTYPPPPMHAHKGAMQLVDTQKLKNETLFD